MLIHGQSKIFCRILFLTVGLIMSADNMLIAADTADLIQLKPHRIPKPWPSKPPKDCPFKPSTTITGIAFTGRYAHYTKGDAWYPRTTGKPGPIPN